MWVRKMTCVPVSSCQGSRYRPQCIYSKKLRTCLQSGGYDKKTTADLSFFRWRPALVAKTKAKKEQTKPGVWPLKVHQSARVYRVGVCLLLPSLALEKSLCQSHCPFWRQLGVHRVRGRALEGFSEQWTPTDPVEQEIYQAHTYVCL